MKRPRESNIPKPIKARRGWLHLTVPVVLVWLVVGAARVCYAETWAERLGYPSGRRVLILYASQMGMCYETSQAAQMGLQNGYLQSASVMPACPWFNEAAQWCQQHPEHDVGLSLTMNSEWSHYRWSPVSPRTAVPSLVDPEGYLWRSVFQFSVNGRTDEAQREIDAQLRKARESGFRPSHLLPHLGALLVRPDVAAAYLETARKQWIPAVIVELTPEHINRFRALGTPLDSNLERLIRDYPLPKLDDVRFVPMAETYEAKREQFYELVRSLAPGITQIVVHPAVESDALKSITDRWQQSVWDAQLMADAEVHQFLVSEKVFFTNWKEIMRRFEGTVPPEEIEPEVDGPAVPAAQ